MNLRHRVNLQSDGSTDDTIDPSYSNTWKNVPCNIVTVTGGERYRGRQLQAETTNVIEMRYLDNILPNMIAVDSVDSTNYTITRVLDKDKRQRFLFLEAVEVVV